MQATEGHLEQLQRKLAGAQLGIANQVVAERQWFVARGLYGSRKNTCATRGRLFSAFNGGSLVVDGDQLVLPMNRVADDLIAVDGTSHTCEILKVEEDGVLARGKMKSGDVVEVKVPVARLDPLCFYTLRDAAIGKDGQARIRFAVCASCICLPGENAMCAHQLK